MESLRRADWLVRALRQRAAGLVAALACTGLAAVFYLRLPGWAATFVADVVPTRDTAAVASHLGVGLALFSAATLLGFARSYLLTRLSFGIASAGRRAAFESIVGAPPPALGGFGGGELLSTMSHDLQILQEATLRVAVSLVPSTILLLVFVAVMAVESILLLACLAVLASPMAMAALFLMKRLHAATHASQVGLARLVGQIEEAAAGLREIKILGAESAVRERFAATDERTLAAQLDREVSSALYPAAVALAAGVAVALVMLGSAIMLERGYVDVETLTAFLALAALAYPTLQDASNSYPRLIQLVAVIDRLSRVTGLASEARNGAPLCAASVRGALRFEAVSFGREGRSFAVEHIDLALAPGERVALVGASGAGKSTLLDMVPLFLRPTSGRILVDEVDVTRVRLADLRRAIGVAFQETLLFEGTLLDNLRLGAPDATPSDIETAAEAANLRDVLETLPGGYESWIEPRGRNLSVGQRQRVGLARVFLQNPPILLLDEPTSALDPASEVLVRDAIARVSKGRTLLLVTHRLDAFPWVDRVVTLDRGRLVRDVAIGRGSAAAPAVPARLVP